MRIIGGALRGRRLIAPAGSATRPTADRVRQALFDILAHAPWSEPGTIEGARVLDAFAGSGALGLEALSRGAAEAVFFETDARACRALSANIAGCGMEGRARIIAADAARPPPGAPCSLVFLDPPYGEAALPARALAALVAAGWLAPAAFVVVETAADSTLPPLATLLAERRHGAARLGFFRYP
ncbi:MAG: 16S rRNA (guanine(966)-N(2))-methyltransferase RsmD [Rhodospirillales bacterium]|nr:16S rRNA (guanine(966)-N(2))-methyltransferase RsmD [Rhodospirillales bacterium]